jgi:hypothetical protein
MRRWGIVITLFYSLIVVALLVPGAFLLATDFSRSQLHDVPDLYRVGLVWLPVGIVIAGQALLLFLSVDTSLQRLKPRTHILMSVLTAAGLCALLAGAAILSLGFGIYGDKFGGSFFDHGSSVLYCWVALWGTWAIVFYLYFRNASAQITRVTSWLLKGSVLELLIAVPAHVIVRRRNDCSAPAATSFGIATGIAVMLLCFGPSALLLYKKRLQDYQKRVSAAN